MAIKITGTFIPGGNFPLLEDTHLLGGFRVVDTETERDSIPPMNRKFGMVVYVTETAKYYTLQDDGTGDPSVNNWVEINFNPSGQTSGLKIDYLESVFNIDLTNPPSQIDYKDIADGDVVCLTQQQDPRENGFWVVDSQNGWHRPAEFDNGTSVEGIYFIVSKGCLNEDTLWTFTNNAPDDIVGTSNLYLTKLSTDGVLDHKEYFLVDNLIESNQYIELEYYPVSSHHVIVTLNGVTLAAGNGLDYEVKGRRVIFYHPIIQNDQIQVYYGYRPGNYCIPPEPPSPYFEFDLVITNTPATFQIDFIELSANADNIEIDWGDGTTETYGYNLNNIQHTYNEIGTKHIRILGHDWIKFNTDPNTTYDWSITVTNWGLQDRWVRFNGMFAYMQNINIDLAGNTELAPTNPVSMEDMFRESPNFNADISGWDVTNVTSFKNMFNGASSFNQDISGWVFPNVADMTGMFANTHDFNQPIGTWDVSNVTNMSHMFEGTYAFNRDISTWNTGNATDMSYMFANSANFNQNISNWDVSNVTACQYFRDNSALTCENTPIGLPSGCTGCFNNFKFKITVSAGQSLYLGNIQSKGEPGNDLVIDTGDGNVENLGQTYNNNYTHTYTSGGTYIVQIHGFKYLKFAGINTSIPIEIIHWGSDFQAVTSIADLFNSVNVTINADDILAPTNTVNCYSTFRNILTNPDVSSMYIKPSSLNATFFGASNFTGQGLENWDVSQCTTLKDAFRDCTSFTGTSIENWDFSNITDGSTAFYNARGMNPDTSNWRFPKLQTGYLMFNGCRSCTFTGVNNWNITTQLQTAYSMFGGCVALQDESFSNWDVSGVTTMQNMFIGCSNFIGNGLENWDISSNTNLYQTFYGCTNFNAAIGNWNTSNVTTMSRTFQNCTNFNQPLNWDTSNTTTFREMFYNCANFNSQINFTDVSKVTTCYRMFRECYAFNQPLNNWNLASCTSTSEMFYGCDVFNQPLNSWNVSSVQDMSRMFTAAKQFNQPLDQWDVSNVTTINGIFWSASNFNGDVTTWNTSNVTDMSSAFRGAYNFNQSIVNWDTSNVTSMYHMFESAISFDQPIGSWNVSNVTNMEAMFASAKSFNQDINSWDVSKVTTFKQMFYGNNGMQFNGDLNNWNTASATNMSQMFRFNNVFNGQIGSWNTSEVTDMSYMFQGSSAFNQDISSWDVSNVTNMSYMFDGATTFNQPIGSWNPASVNNMDYMFRNATSFNQDISNWNVSNVTSMNYMFNGANHFDMPLNSWNVSNVTQMAHMFENADLFNQPLDQWDTGNVVDMTAMFYNNDAFNQNISMWNVSNVQYCSNFRGGTSVLDCSNTPPLPSACTGC